MKNVQIHRIIYIYIYIYNNSNSKIIFIWLLSTQVFFVHCQRKLIIGKLTNDRNKKKKEKVQVGPTLTKEPNRGTTLAVKGAFGYN